MSSILIDKLLQTAIARRATGVSITAGESPVLCLNGRRRRLQTQELQPEDVLALMRSITPYGNQQELQETGKTEFEYAFIGIHISNVGWREPETPVFRPPVGRPHVITFLRRNSDQGRCRVSVLKQADRVSMKDKEETPYFRSEVALSLVKTRQRSAIDAVIAELASPNAFAFRAHVADALTMSVDSRAYLRGVAALEDDASCVCLEVARVLAESVSLRSQQVYGGTYRERNAILAALRDHNVIAKLMEVAADERKPERLRSYLRKALEKSGHRQALEFLKKTGEAGQSRNTDASSFRSPGLPILIDLAACPSRAAHLAKQA